MADVTAEIRRHAAEILGDTRSQCARAYIAGDASRCSCEGRSHAWREQENAGRVLAEIVAKAEQRGEDKAAKRILDFAKKLNFGPTLRTFIKKVSRGEHLEE